MISSSERSRPVMAGRIAQPTTAGLTRYGIRSHPARITWPAAALGRHPVDILRRVLDVARFAMHAVLRVDPQLWFAGHFLDLIHSRWAVPRLRAAIQLVVNRDRLRGIEQLKV